MPTIKKSSKNKPLTTFIHTFLNTNNSVPNFR